MQSVHRSKEYWLVDSRDQNLSHEILFPYAWDEWICRQMTIDSPSYIHIWQHPKAFVLGLRDRQLPHIKQAISWLESQGNIVAVRNSGGAAVPLDAGVVNISLVAPKPNHTLNFRDDFETMIELLRENLLLWTSAIQVGEIKGSYCPGDYDLSIKGLKFCGIAQRRQANAFVLQAFVNVEGLGSDRSSLVRTFYDIATNGDTTVSYPLVEAERMSSLQELVNMPSAHAFIESLRNLKSILVPETQEARVLLNKMVFQAGKIYEVMTQMKKRYAIE
jgi:octanoyl-[GcvH]:protein N-octanoyltransferase